MEAFVVDRCLSYSESCWPLSICLQRSTCTAIKQPTTMNVVLISTVGTAVVRLVLLTTNVFPVMTALASDVVRLMCEASFL